MERVAESSAYPCITLGPRLVCDLELLMNGGFAPLRGFLNENDYNSVVEDMRLTSGELWPMPIVLPVVEKECRDLGLEVGSHVTLKDNTGLPLAILDIESIWKPDLVNECIKCYGSDDDNHPYVQILMGLGRDGSINYVGGTIRCVNMPKHYDFTDIRMSPQECKEFFVEHGWRHILGFQTRNPMHRCHFELTKYAMRKSGEDDIKLFLNPVVGITQDCDVDYHLRVKCYKKLMDKYDKGVAVLNLLPLSMRMAGPREAVWHALIRKNHGCTHFVVGRDHAGPSYKKKNGENFYGPYDAHCLLMLVEEELGVKIILSEMIVYVENLGVYMPINEVSEGMRVLNISGTEQRQLLNAGHAIPSWFSFPEIAAELQREFIGDNAKGICLYFVGLSGSGKSTIAQAVQAKLREITYRPVSILDGDIVRLHLSKGLGFTKEDRSINVRRIGFVASEIVKHRGIVLCANIAPYLEDRVDNRRRIAGVGGHYIEIYVKTSVDKCEERDVKGLYKMAREGKIKQFTGVSDPFEEPENAELVLDGDESVCSIETNVGKIIKYLSDRNYI